jgi:hypothetical protein
MVLGFGNTQTAWDKADVAVDDLLKAARKLYTFFFCFFYLLYVISLLYKRVAYNIL